MLPVEMTAANVLGIAPRSEDFATPFDDVKCNEGKKTAISEENLLSNLEMQPAPVNQDYSRTTNDGIDPEKAARST